MRQEFAKSGRASEFKMEPLTPKKAFGNFNCGIPEYNHYLITDAQRSMNDHIALTWLLTERSTGKIAAYMALIMDTNDGRY